MRSFIHVRSGGRILEGHELSRRICLDFFDLSDLEEMLVADERCHPTRHRFAGRAPETFNRAQSRRRRSPDQDNDAQTPARQRAQLIGRHSQAQKATAPGQDQIAFGLDPRGATVAVPTPLPLQIARLEEIICNSRCMGVANTVAVRCVEPDQSDHLEAGLPRFDRRLPLGKELVLRRLLVLEAALGLNRGVVLAS